MRWLSCSVPQQGSGGQCDGLGAACHTCRCWPRRHHWASSLLPLLLLLLPRPLPLLFLLLPILLLPFLLLPLLPLLLRMHQTAARVASRPRQCPRVWSQRMVQRMRAWSQRCGPWQTARARVRAQASSSPPCLASPQHLPWPQDLVSIVRGGSPKLRHLLRAARLQAPPNPGALPAALAAPHPPSLRSPLQPPPRVRVRTRDGADAPQTAGLPPERLALAAEGSNGARACHGPPCPHQSQEEAGGIAGEVPIMVAAYECWFRQHSSDGEVLIMLAASKR